MEYTFEDDDDKSYDSENDNNDDDFLNELGNDVYQEKSNLTVKELAKKDKADAKATKLLILEGEREMKRQIREDKKAQLEQIKFDKHQKKINGKSNDNDSLYGDATPILGKDKILLLKKVKQYKSLFPEELKTFKIKKNPNITELSDALTEMEVLVETHSVDGFLMDSVLQCIKLIENVSSVSSNYDIRGCADLLKSNKQFNTLAKQLFIKYNVFSSVPAEYQMILLVSTTAYICTNKNKNKHQIDAYLNETI